MGAGTYKKLRFRFVQGMFSDEVFEFDVDTDGGAGVAGGSMRDLQVTLTLGNGTILSGCLATDPADPQRSVLSF
jgi:hypothetical protein